MNVIEEIINSDYEDEEAYPVETIKPRQMARCIPYPGRRLLLR